MVCMRAAMPEIVAEDNVLAALIRILSSEQGLREN